MNLILPFVIDGALFKGRYVKIDSVMDELLARRSYPPLVAQILAESIALACMLADSIKYKGTFTLQIQGNGPVSLLVTDVTDSYEVRAYAQYDEDKLPEGVKSIREIFGEGTLSFIADSPYSETERYQGVVALEGDTLAQCAVKYFGQSEQLLTQIMLFSEAVPSGEQGDTLHYAAGGVMLQKMPEKKNMLLTDNTIDKWEEADILLKTLKKEELFDAKLLPEKLLFRLFHEHDLTIFPKKDIVFKCRCSRKKVAEMLGQFSKEERASLYKDGEISVTCQFCGKEYKFKEEDFEKTTGKK